MTCAGNTKDYINRKLAGEDVVSPGSLYGHLVLSEGLESGVFLVVDIDLDSISFYRYASKNGRIRIIDCREDVSHALGDILDLNDWLDKATNMWWNCVFFECKGRLNYDRAYDVLSVSDNCNTPFKALLDGVSNLFASLFQSSMTMPAFIHGDLSQSPLVRYVLQQMTGFPVKVLPKQEKEVSFNENAETDIPEEKLSHLSISMPISFYQMTSKPVTITFPISSFESELVSGIPWKSLLADDSIDYCVGELGFKVIKLFVECDPFQNVFLSSIDTHGNRRVIRY